MTVLADVGRPTVRQVVPDGKRVTVDDVVARVLSAPTSVPFADEAIAFCTAFGERLRRVSRGRPETQALAYWMRAAELRRLRSAFAALGDDRTMLVPRGTVFHIPPANVDTVFVYSWVLSLLVGNRNIIRLPRRAGDQAALITQVLGDLIEDGSHPGIQAANAMITYEPDPAVTEALSAACDLRVIWGGDATVTEVRRSPLPPRATELTFPDRFSLAALDARGYLALARDERQGLVERFFADAYAFDQLGCSSPRLVVWIGGVTESDLAATDFFTRLARTAQNRGYGIDAAAAIARLGFLHRAVIDRPVVSTRFHGNHVAVLRLDSCAGIRGEFCGGGVFFELRLDALSDLAEVITPRDQTLVQFGFDREELMALVRDLNGRGIDRIVPVGEALTFDRVWDGQDLVQAFARRTTVDLERMHLT
ncbi:acyl-CoA reductase [Actinoplanes sp. NPDC049548]|uniref:acyl-CoA reductase n=1 Tax=Actinoplanes sp. NPDC049548 TaxID=3155152 RepID=UPI0034232F4E